MVHIFRFRMKDDISSKALAEFAVTFKSLGYASRSSVGPNCVGFTKSDTTTISFSSRHLLIRLACPSCRNPIVGTRPIVFPSLFQFLIKSLVSFTVDEDLLEAAGIMEYEKVQIVDVNNGSRFETYTICGKRGSGMICLNGAAARCVSTGDKIIIMCYAHYDSEEAKEHKPQVVFVDEENKISRVTNYEKHGLLKDMA